MLSLPFFCYRKPTATILPTIEVPRYRPAPIVASFSSRGPSSLTENILKVTLYYVFQHAFHLLSMYQELHKHLENSELTIFANLLSSLMSWLQELPFWLP